MTKENASLVLLFGEGVSISFTLKTKKKRRCCRTWMTHLSLKSLPLKSGSLIALGTGVQKTFPIMVLKTKNGLHSWKNIVKKTDSGICVTNSGLSQKTVKSLFIMVLKLSRGKATIPICKKTY